jgi:hypothetical protein
MTGKPVRPALTAALLPTLSSWPTMPVPRAPRAARPGFPGRSRRQFPGHAAMAIVRCRGPRWQEDCRLAAGPLRHRRRPTAGAARFPLVHHPVSRQGRDHHCLGSQDRSRRLVRQVRRLRPASGGRAHPFAGPRPAHHQGAAPMRVHGHRPEDRPASRPLAQALARGLMATAPASIAG